MTLAELIEALKGSDPTSLICICDPRSTAPFKPHPVPAADTLRFAVINDYHCIVLDASPWPEAA